MTRYKSTPEGNIPFTPEEEAEWDALEAQAIAKRLFAKQQKSASNATGSYLNPIGPKPSMLHSMLTANLPGRCTAKLCG
jgi:hypothetical protein